MIRNNDRSQSRVRDWAAYKGDVAHPWKPKIADVLTPAIKKPGVLFPFCTSADTILGQTRLS
jgi:hypothetical protein